MRHLLNHTSGISNFTEEPALYETSSRTRSMSGPRSNSYDSLLLVRTFIVLGLAEATSGQTLEALLRERLFVPLSLTRTTFPSDQMLPAPFAHGYVRVGGAPVDSTAVHPSFAGAAGAIVSTAADVARFYRELLGGRLLPPPQLGAMRTLRFINSKYGCAKAWGHTGAIFGYQTIAFSSIRGRRQVVLLVNTELNARQFDSVNTFVTTAFCS